MIWLLILIAIVLGAGYVLYKCITNNDTSANDDLDKISDDEIHGDMPPAPPVYGYEMNSSVSQVTTNSYPSTSGKVTL